MRPFGRSLAAILDLVAKEKGAEVALLYEYRPEASTLCALAPRTHRVSVPAPAAAALLRLRAASQVISPETLPPGVSEALLQGFSGYSLLTVPTATPVFLYLGWRRHRSSQDLSRMQAYLDAIGVILQRAEKDHSVRSLIDEIARLQMEIADCKIAERTNGLIREAANDRSQGERVRKFTDRVLESSADTVLLSRRVGELRAELASRNSISRAKLVLQTKLGVTEQQAYLRLHQSSRRSRRPLADVAAEVIATADIGGGGRQA